MRVRVITDSSTNVPDSYLTRLGIVETPAIVNFGTETFLNKVELTPEEFYRRLATEDRLPTTAQPSPRQFADAYGRLAAEGADAAIVVCVSGKMSGTLNSALIAAENAPLTVYGWDSLSASLGAGWQAIAAAEMARDGLDAPAILERLAPIRARMQTATAPTTLRFLVASGRVARLRGSIGDLLNVKPILSMVDGILAAVGQARGYHRALATVLERVVTGLGDRPARVGIAHANAPEAAEAFLAMVRARVNVAEAVITEIGPALATFGGPGIIALSAYAVGD